MEQRFREYTEQRFREYLESGKNIQKLLNNISFLHDKPDEVTDLIDHTSIRILKKFPPQ